METEYASKGVAGSGLGLGIAGTVLGLMNAHGGGWGGFGGANGLGGVAANAAGGAMILDIARKDAEIAQLKADAATDKKLVEVYTNLAKNDKELTGKGDVRSVIRPDVDSCCLERRQQRELKPCTARTKARQRPMRTLTAEF